MKVFYILFIIFCSNILSAQEQKVAIYNMDELIGGFKGYELNTTINGVKIYFNQEFVDGESIGKYQNKEIKINNCQDLYKYDLRDIEGLVITDKQILLERKRACILQDIILELQEIEFLEHSLSQQIADMKTILTYFKFKGDNSTIKCNHNGYYGCVFDDTTWQTKVFASRILSINKKDAWIVNTQIENNNRSRRFYLIWLNEGKLDKAIEIF